MFGLEENEDERGQEGAVGAGGAGAAEAEGEGGGSVRCAEALTAEPKRRKMDPKYSDSELKAAAKQKDYGSNFGGQSTADIFCFVCNSNGNTNYVTVECETIIADKLDNMLGWKNKRKKNSRLLKVYSSGSLSGSLDRSCPMCCKCANVLNE